MKEKLASVSTTATTEGIDILKMVAIELENGNIKPKDLLKLTTCKKDSKIDPRTKGYSEENVKKMVSMIEEGYTSNGIIEKLFPEVKTRQTLKRYLDRHYRRKGYVTKYWKMLLENDQNETSTDVDEVEETEVKPTEAEGTDYILDPYLIINKDERTFFPAIIEKLEKTKSKYVIHNRYLLEDVAKNYKRYAAECAQEVLATKQEHFTDSNLNLYCEAAANGYTVITAHEKTKELCKLYGVKVMMPEEFLG